ncbi:hypothetical protein SESBI_13812 [Sesbania bispinosa]|nr:hypothetical protein SESBI_13812 [Sesbania bispinosa]
MPNTNHTSNLPPFPRLSICNDEMFQRLYDARFMVGNYLRPWQPLYLAWYNPSLTCHYHMDALGHSIETCEGFKIVVRKLIISGKLNIQEEVVNNSMPNRQKEEE